MHGVRAGRLAAARIASVFRYDSRARGPTHTAASAASTCGAWRSTSNGSRSATAPSHGSRGRCGGRSRRGSRSGALHGRGCNRSARGAASGGRGAPAPSRLRHKLPCRGRRRHAFDAAAWPWCVRRGRAASGGDDRRRARRRPVRRLPVRRRLAACRHAPASARRGFLGDADEGVRATRARLHDATPRRRRDVRPRRLPRRSEGLAGAGGRARDRERVRLRPDFDTWSDHEPVFFGGTPR